MNRFLKRSFSFTLVLVSGCEQKFSNKINKKIQWKGYFNKNPFYINIDENFPNKISNEIIEAINLLDNYTKGIMYIINTDYPLDVKNMIYIICNYNYENIG